MSLRTFIASFLLTVVVRAEEAPKTPPAKPQAVEARPNLLDPPVTRYCNRDGESLETRIERLEVALRLAKMELKVNAKRHK